MDRTCDETHSSNKFPIQHLQQIQVLPIPAFDSVLVSVSAEKNDFWIVVNSDENPKMWAVEYGCSFSLLLKTCDIWLFCTVSKPINFHVCIESLDCCFAHLDTKGDKWEPIDENALSD